MFKKNEDTLPEGAEKIEPSVDGPAKSAPAGESNTRSVSYIGPSLEFTGDIRVKEALIIEGQIKGSVTCTERRLTIGKQGRVEGEVHAEEVEVRGNVEGDVHGYERIRLHSSASVTGTLHCRRIIMEDGAELNGSVDMQVDRKALAKKVVKAVDKREGKAATAGADSGKRHSA